MTENNILSTEEIWQLKELFKELWGIGNDKIDEYWHAGAYLFVP